MNEERNENQERREEPERVRIPFPPNPAPEPRRPGEGSDTTALIFAILSLFASSCLPPAAVVLAILSFAFLKRYRAAGGEWRGNSIAAALISGLGILFSILAVILIVLAFVGKDPNSIYGFLYQVDV